MELLRLQLDGTPYSTQRGPYPSEERPTCRLSAREFAYLQRRNSDRLLLDLIDREMKSDFNVVLSTREIEAGFTVKMLSTQAGDLPLIPDWSLAYTGTPGSGSAVLPAYIVTEDLIEYHWLSDPNPRVFQLGVPGSLASQYVVVKFGAPVVKGASYAHYQVLVDR